MRFPKQISVRTFAILCFAIALCLAYWVSSSKKQQMVAISITENGGRVTYEKPSEFVPRFMISAFGQDYFCAIDCITLYPTTESPADEQIRLLKDYPELRRLAIWPGVKGMKSSTRNDYPGGLSDNGALYIVENLPNLNHLSLLSARMTDKSIRKLKNAKSLESFQYDMHPAFRGVAVTR